MMDKLDKEDKGGNQEIDEISMGLQIARSPSQNLVGRSWQNLPFLLCRAGTSGGFVGPVSS